MSHASAGTTAARFAQLRTFAVALVIMWSFVAVRNGLLHRPRTAILQATGALVSLGAWWLCRKDDSERRLQLVGNASLAAWAVLLICNSFLNGGTLTTPFILSCMPPAAAYILGIRQAVVWAIAAFVSAASVILVGHLELIEPEFRQGTVEVVFALLLPVQAALLVLSVASRRATDAQLAKARASEAIERKQSEELLVARDAALEGARAKGAFLANMSHELRTPLNAIIGMTSLLDDAPLSDQQRDCIATIRSSGETLLALLSDILDLSKIEAGKVELERLPMDLAQCVEGAVDLVAPAAAAKGLEITWELSSGTPAWIVADRTRLQQVLLNLLGNAVKFTERGDVALTVDARAVGDETELEVRVRDDGIGIPEDKLDRLFQTFSQVDASTTRQFGGAGLGLAISKALVALLGGRIWVQSKAGQGSTFAFTVRARSVAPPALPAREATPDFAGLRVLVVSAHEGVRGTVERLLTRRGARVTAHTGVGADALGGSWDAAVVDAGSTMEPGLAGAALLRRQLPDVPIVLLTAVSVDSKARQLAADTVTAVVAKPVKPARLLAALARSRAGDSSASLRPFAAERAPSPSRPLRVLVAEDNVVNQKVQRRLLEHMGHRVDVVADGLAAILAVRQQAYDAVLLDVQMPHLDGIETARRLVAELPSGRPRLIALTANAMPEDRALCLEAGMDRYLSKPVRLVDLDEALRDVPPAANAPVPGTADDALLDQEVLAGLLALEKASGEPLVGPLFEEFLAGAPRRLDAVDAALAQGNARDVEFQAHSLKGSAGALGLTRVAALAASIETGARTQALDALRGDAGKLRLEIDRAAPALRELASREGLPAPSVR